MSLDMGTAVGGEFTDLMAMHAANGNQPFLIITRAKAYHPSEQMKNGMVHPVTVDILFVTGPRAGECELDERLIGNGQTGSLRGVANPKRGSNLPASPPAHPVGKELGWRVDVDRTGSVPYVKFDPPTPAEAQQIIAAHANGQGWATAQAKTAARQAAQFTPQIPATPPPVAVTPAPAAFEVPAAAPVAPPPVAAPVQPAAPTLPPGMTPEAMQAFLAWQAAQASQAQPPAPQPPAPQPAPVGGPPAPAPWQQ